MQSSTTAEFYFKYLLNAPANAVAGSESPAISEYEVHIWIIDLLKAPVLDEVLSPEELERAARFDCEKDRHRFKAARSALRTILGRYLRKPASSLLFGRTEFGKPFIVNPEKDGLLFNVSQSGDLALLAVAREREVGIDLKAVRPFSMDRAVQFLSVAEIYTLSGLHPELRSRAFFECLTRKQAYVKARGEDVSMPMDSFDVSLAPSVPAAMLRNRIDQEETSRWQFQNLQIAPGHSGAVVFESLRSQPRLSYFVFGG